MKVFINIPRENASPVTGIGQVVLAQYNLLPRFGWDVTPTPENADVIAAHIEGQNLTKLDVLHCHGLYFRDVPHLPYSSWHRSVNVKIAAAARRASLITVPSDWVGEVFRRDMRLRPTVIGHGVELKEWRRATNPKGYLYYNKNRESDVCTAKWAWELADRVRNVQLISTFKPSSLPMLPNTVVTGLTDHDEVIRTMAGAGVYLATTLETFGIGTVEALAAGVPVLGFDWGGIRDIVDHRVNGYLARPEDTDDLFVGLDFIRSNWQALSEAAIVKAQQFSWPAIIERYAELYSEARQIRQSRESSGVSVVITNHDYGAWVGKAIQSALNQTVPCEVIVVDDGSNDHSREVISGFGEKVRAIFQDNQGVAAARNHGIEAASNEFVFMLDADDWIEPQTVEVCLREMRQDAGLGIVYTGLTLADASGQDYAKSDYPPEFDWKVQSSFAVPPANCIPSACLIRKEMWRRAGGIIQKFAPGEDAEFWTRGLSVGFNAKRATFEGLFHYRNHGSGASKTRRYVRTDDFLPFLHDHDDPMGAPTASKQIEIRSYLTPAVSVIIPVGPGHERLVVDAIRSITGQTLREWELIVVNDSGADLSGLLEPFPFIKLIANPGKHGAGAARNIGIRAAKAPTLVFLDADDLLKPDTLKHMLDAFIASGGKYIYTDWMSDDGTVLETFQSKPYNQSEWRMVHPVTTLMATEDARKLMFDEDLPGWEDWDYFLKAATQGICGERLPEVLLVYRTLTGQRRKLMQDQAANVDQKVLEIMRSRYQRYFTGEQAMPGCCGGGANPILAAKRAISGQIDAAQPEAARALPVNRAPDVSPTVVRMEYTGVNIGEISYQANGRVYRGGNNPLHKYKDVLVEDAPILERSGKWQRVAPVVPPAPAVPASVVQPEIPEPVEIDEVEAVRAQQMMDKLLQEAKIRESSHPAELSGEKKPTRRKKA